TLAMAEVNRIMDLLHHRCEGVPVLMGAAITREPIDSLFLAVMIAPPEDAAAGSLDDEAAGENSPRGQAEDLGVQLLNGTGGARRHSRFLPPPPSLPQEKMAQLLKEQTRGAGSARKIQSKLRQTQLPSEIISKGRC